MTKLPYLFDFYRFYGRIAENPNNHDEKILECIKNNVSGLQRISGERIWVELKKILSGNFAGDLLKTMLELDIGKYIGNHDLYYISDIKQLVLSHEIKYI